MSRTYDSRWQALRPAILERDGHLCQIQLPGCTGTATDVDHIVPIAEGGRRLDPDNLRAACGWCNNARRRGRNRALIRALEHEAGQPSPNW